MSYESEVLADAPLIYWRLGDASGTTAVDDSGNGIDGTYYNSPTLGVTGLIGDADTAVTFPNSGTDIKADSGTWPTTDVACPSGFSLECWVKFSTLGGFGDVVAIYGPGSGTNATSNDVEIALDFTGGNHFLGYWFQCSSGTDAVVFNYDAFSGVTAGTTYHIVLTFDGVDTVKFYVNGSLVESQTLVSPTLPFTIFSDSNGNPLTVADDGFNQGDGTACTIDEVALYDSELDASRVAAHYAAGTPATDYPTAVAADSPYIWLRCGDASGDLVDSGSAGFDMPVGSFGAPPTYAVASLQDSDGDLAFHASAGTALTDSAHDLATIVGTPTDGFTIELFVNFTAFDDGYLFTEQNDGPTLAISASGDLTAYFNDASLALIQTAPYALALDTTYYLAATFDKATGDFVFYVDGVAVETQPAAATEWVWSGNPAYLDVCFGFNNLLEATIDDVAFYLTGLSADRILAHWVAAAVGTAVDRPFYWFSLNSVQFGAGFNNVSLENIEGLGVPDAKTQDVGWVHNDGAYANPDYVSVRVVTFHAIIRATSAADAMDSLTTLESSFAPVPADVPLEISLPGWGSFTMNGRPRGIRADLTLARYGVIRALCRFDCPDPTIAYA